MRRSDDEIILPDSDRSTAFEANLPISDDNDAMDVVQSDEQDIPMSPANTAPGSDSDDLVLPESPLAMRPNVSARGMAGIQRDPSTGHFTAASFANFPDELLD
jgi:hypothetical protein